MEDIKEEKILEIKWNERMKKRIFEKKDIEEKIKEVQLTKVTKEMQAALTKKRDKTSQDS